MGKCTLEELDRRIRNRKNLVEVIEEEIEDLEEKKRRFMLDIMGVKVEQN